MVFGRCHPRNFEANHRMPSTTIGRGSPRVRGRAGSKGRGHRKGRLGRHLNDGRPESAIDIVEEAEAVSEEGTLDLG
jgi:hypothetical protein